MMERPRPFVPEEVDLRSYVFMPLEVGRLRDSDTAASVSGEAFRAAVLLWCAAWHQLPAASLPDNDGALARLAGFGRHVDDWRAVREEALRGFTLCSDGRLYHSTLAEIALGAWNDKKRKHARTAAATEARQAGRKAALGEDLNQRDGQRNVERNVNVSSTKEKKEKKERKEGQEGHPARRHAWSADAFDLFWKLYPRKVKRQDARKAFDKIARSDAVAFDVLMKGLRLYISTKPDYQDWAHPTSWLNGRRWEDEAPSGARTSTNGCGTEDRIDFGGGVRWPESTVREQVARWRVDPSTWPEERLGPPPSAPGCRVPDHLLRMAA